MSTVLSPIAPGAAGARDAPLLGLAPAPRPVAALESARAVQPVAPDPSVIRARNPNARERPVGPPPTFEVNVLEDLRQRLLDVEVGPVQSDPGSPAPPGTPEGVYAELATHPDEGSHLDRKL